MVVRFSEITLLYIFIVCRILQHMCVQYLFELVEFLLPVYLPYLHRGLQCFLCSPSATVLASIYISGSICASIF